MNQLSASIFVGLGIALASSAVDARTLNQVKQRGQLICSANTGRGGFALPDAQGNWAGLDVDYCRAIAAAVLGDATKVKFVPTDATSRFESVKSGAADVLLHNTTWTLSRDSSQGLDFEATRRWLAAQVAAWREQSVDQGRPAIRPAPRQSADVEMPSLS